MAAPISPLAPAELPTLPPIAGLRIAAAEAGIRYRHRKDVLLALFEPAATVAGLFTRSACPSAPVDWCRAQLASGRARALVVNSGNANAFTGVKGRSAVKATAVAAAKAAGCRPEEVFLASTGVIGEPLDPAPFERVLGELARSARADAFSDAAEAIMTTDTFAKCATRQVDLGGTIVTLNGIAKGAGMIAPDMATMLCFVFTDATLEASALQAALAAAVRPSFNSITVDGDTSTSDTVLAFATGAAGGRPVAERGDRRLAVFRRALSELLIELAQLVVRDGEGASKFVTVEVEGATSRRSANRIALSIANSPLVKTAIAGEDANWGRVVMAVGKAGEPADRDRLAIWFGDIRVAVEGERDPAYDEATAAAYMKGQELTVKVDLGLGRGRARVWTCDLTHDYIAINADYRS